VPASAGFPEVDSRSSVGIVRPGGGTLVERSLPAPARSGSHPRGDVAPAWRTILAGTPREVLARLVQGDPLGVRGVVANRLRSGSVLLDADRIHLRAIARIARSAGRYRGRPAVDAWVDGHVVQVLADVIREDHESTRAGAAAPAEVSEAFSALAGPLGLDPGSMRRACAVFNVLPLADRAAFVDLVLRNRSLDEMARELGENATQIARRARRALDAILGSARSLGEPRGQR